MMKSKKKFILLLAVFIVLIAGSAIAYQALKDKGQTNVLKETNTKKDTDKKRNIIRTNGQCKRYFRFQ